MKTFLSTLILFLFYSTINAQDLIGSWTGELNVMNNKIEMTFHISEKNGELETTLDIPVQGLKSHKATLTSYNEMNLEINFNDLGFSYSGALDEDRIVGRFNQNNMSFPMILKRGVITLNRPQTPQEPFNYNIEDFTFTSQDGTKIAGTLTTPKDKKYYPLAIIISGSGPQNRDGELFGHSLYWVIADHLTKNGIAVLRYDERGVGESEGDFSTSQLIDFQKDTESAIEYLNKRTDINTDNLGLIGHSIGGIIAPQIALNNESVKYVVMMAGPGLDGDQVMLLQKAGYEKLMGLDQNQINYGQNLFKGAYDIVKNTTLEAAPLKDTLLSYFNTSFQSSVPESELEAIIEQIMTPELLAILRNKPSSYITNISQPILALNGDKDFQITAKENIESLQKLFNKKQKKNKAIVLKNINHLFQEAETGSLQEYGQIEQTISPQVLEIITQWIKDL